MFFRSEVDGIVDKYPMVGLSVLTCCVTIVALNNTEQTAHQHEPMR